MNGQESIQGVNVPTAKNGKRWQMLKRVAATCGLLAVAAAAQQSGSLLDRLPRVAPGHYAEALQAARARGAAGAADAAWIELFYGNAAAKQQAEEELRKVEPQSHDAEMALVQFLNWRDQGEDRQAMAAALHLVQLAPNDPAGELAARAISGTLDDEGRTLLDAAPALREVMQQRLSNPTTVYMLGRPLLALVRATGVDLSLEQSIALSGRIEHWSLIGPFGQWPNLDFDRSFPVETQVANQYSDGGATRTAYVYDSVRGAVTFPRDWAGQGVDYAVSYVHAPRNTTALLRLYSSASTRLWINGVAVTVNDRRSSYRPATVTARVELQGGWNRVVIKLAGYANREFSLVLRPEQVSAREAGAALTSAAQLPAGAHLAGAPRLLPAPPTLAAWAQARLKAHPQDAVALWLDAEQRLQDEDAETARAELKQAAKLAPEASPVWLDLAEASSLLDDASQSWAAAQTEAAAQQALKADPNALRAWDRLGHIAESEGKQTEAAKDYAHCTGHGYADCDWSAFHLAARQRWLPEARTALRHAVAESGSDWAGLSDALDFYSSVGDAPRVSELLHRLQSDPRAGEALGGYLLGHGRPVAATPLLAAEVKFDPSSAGLRQQYLEALYRSGDLPAADAAAQTAQKDFPYDWRIASEASDIALRKNPQQGVQDLRQHDFNRNILRHEADFLAGDKFWAPWYHSEQEVIQNAPGKQQYPNASAILVLDQMVDRINPDSTRDSYIHQIFRVLDSTGIQMHGTVHLPEGSDLITVRTIKQDGSILLPEKLSNLSSITMPGLEPGDYVETEYVMHSGPSQIVPDTLDNNMFFVFNSNREPYHYSDYIVLSPDSYPLVVDQERFPNDPVVKHYANGWTSREWLIQKTRLLVTEPFMPPVQEMVPKVWVSSKLNWDEISAYYADHLFAVGKVTRSMQQLADQVTAGKKSNTDKANALFDWVVKNIQPADGDLLVPARQYFADRAGNRFSAFLALMSAAHVPCQFVLARAYTDHSSLKIPSLFSFQYPLVRVQADHGGDENGQDIWYDLNNAFAHQGYVAAAVRGGEALVAGEHGDAVFTHVPQGISTLDGMVLSVQAKVDDSGTAQVHLTLEFRGPTGEEIRQALNGQPDSRLPQIYQQMLLANYPNGIAASGKIENLNDHQKSLIVEIDGSIPDFVHQDGNQWEISHIVGSVGTLTRYASLPFRVHPLVISGSSFEQAKVDVQLPARFQLAAAPASVHVENGFGRFDANYSLKGQVIHLERTLFLNANVVPTNQYSKFRQFSESVDNQDRLRIGGSVAVAGAPAAAGPTTG